jgi:PAS domain S-box-containing protein
LKGAPFLKSSESNLIIDKISWILENNLFSAKKIAQWCVSILDSIEHGIIVANEHAICQYVNLAYTRITGVTRDQIVGHHVREVRPGAVLPKVMQTGKSMSRIFRREGDIEYVMDVAPIIISGKIIGWVAILKDITEVKQLALDLKRHVIRTKELQSILNYTYKARCHFKDIVGTSAVIQETLLFSKKIAQGESDILISGESGTGKEMFAQAIHNASLRSTKPFIPISCATLTPSLIESELFGYDEGAFTGANKGGKLGFFEIADGGTILLDEIGELPLEMQSKLLRTLQERTIRRVGRAMDLKSMVNEGKFREDLYFRLDVISIHLPPLHDRIGDIRHMSDHFLEIINTRMRRQLKFSSEVYELFYRYHWPGNIRELFHVVEFAVNISENDIIQVCDLPRKLHPDPTLNRNKENSLAEIIRNVERRIIEERLKSYGVTLSAKKRIAIDLGISLSSLYRKMSEMGMDKE